MGRPATKCVAAVKYSCKDLLRDGWFAMDRSKADILEYAVQLLSERSLGAICFLSRSLGKAGKTKEPTDLAGACNGVLLLFWSSRSPSPEKVDEHNLKQARGTLRKWRNGQILTGRNDYEEFSVDYRDGWQVVVLSIGNCDAMHARVHSEWAKELMPQHARQCRRLSSGFLLKPDLLLLTCLPLFMPLGDCHLLMSNH